MGEWVVSRLDYSLDRSEFSCGEPSLDDFFTKYASQYEKKGLCRVYVARHSLDGFIGGYFTLNAGSIRFEHLPAEVAKRLPRHPIPVAHIGRLAVDSRAQGKKLGSLLLIEAINRVVRLTRDPDRGLGVFAIEVFALHENARAFYEHFGFQGLTDSREHLYLPISVAKKLFDDREG